MLLASHDTAPIPEEFAIQQDERESLRKAIELLPALPHVIVWLRYTEAISFIEIARRLHVSPASAKMHYYRACMKLRALLEKYCASSVDQYQAGIRWKHPTKAS